MTALLSPPPGSLTVPPLFGIGAVATTVVVVLVLAVVAFVLLAADRGARVQPEWEAWLQGRRGRPVPPPPQGDADAAAAPARAVRPG